MLFMHVEKNNGFGISCTSFFMLYFYAQHENITKKYNCGAVPDSARKPGGALCPFHSFRLFFIPFLAKN